MNNLEVICKSFETYSMKALSSDVSQFLNKLNDEEILSSKSTFLTTLLRNGNMNYSCYVVYFTKNIN